MHMANADTVLISGDVSGIDVGVVPVNSIGIVRLRGHIFAGGKPLGGVRILATTMSGTVVGSGLTDNLGTYAIESVPAGAAMLTVDAAGIYRDGQDGQRPDRARSRSTMLIS